MADPTLTDRGKSMEEAFFKRESESERLREQISLRHEQERACESLADASGISDTALLDRLASLGIRAETLAALTLIPLVEVAWADGSMDPRERDAVLRGAESSGIAQGTPSYGLLDIWTQDRPPPELLENWKRYIRLLCSELSADQRWHLEERILGRARAVADAAGGFLGLGSRVSRDEEKMLGELATAFAA